MGSPDSPRKVIVATESLVPPPSGRTSLSPLHPGEILNGKYEVGEIIGSGGVGVVLSARHLELDETVAIKVLRADISREADDELVGRFLREAKAAVSLKSEHVVKVLDVSKTPGGIPYLVMEMLHGRDLGTMVTELGQMPISDAVDYTMQACEALALAHSVGIIHRDIKPENLFLADQGHGLAILKVLDFGISKSALRGSILGSAVPLVRTGNLMGTPLYMAPEQVRNAQVDPRTDVWALGLVLYELVTGVTAFNAETITELTSKILEVTPPPVTDVRPDAPEGLQRIIFKCIEKDPALRYQNVAQLASDLLAFAPKRARMSAERASAVLHSSGVTALRVKVPSTMPPPPEVLTHPLLVVPMPSNRPLLDTSSLGDAMTLTGPRPVSESRGKGAVLAIAAVAVLLVAAVGGWAMTRGNAATPAVATNATITSQPVAAPTHDSNERTVILLDRPPTVDVQALPAAKPDPKTPPPPVNANATRPATQPQVQVQTAPPAVTKPAATAAKPAATASTEPDIGY